MIRRLLFFSAFSLSWLCNLSSFANHAIQFPAETYQVIKHLQANLLVAESKSWIHPQLKNKIFGICEINGQHYLNLQGFKNDDFDIHSLISIGALPGASIGKAFSMRYPVAQLDELFSLKGIDYLELPPDYQPFLNRAWGDTRADSVHKSISLPKGFSGKNTIVGIIDWGFDLGHPMFFDSSLQRSRVIGLWDHWKKSGPAPSKYKYGTEYTTESALRNAGSDTANNRGWDTHGSHVAGIAGGAGAGIGLFGMAYECDFLFVQVDWQTGTFLDCVDWMYEQALKANKRLVINMSFGSYHRATLDTNSFFHEVCKEYTKKGVVMITSAGNNGNNKMHLRKDFNADTLKTGISMLPNTTSFPRFWGHSIISWGQKEKQYASALSVYDANSTLLFKTPFVSTNNAPYFVDTFFLIGNDTLYWIVESEKSHPLNNKPRITFKIRKTNASWLVALESTAQNGEVHYWNVIQNTLGTSNTGQPFLATRAGWLAGNDSFTVSDPGVVPFVLTVAAHSSEVRYPNGATLTGEIASFSSRGPTMDGLIKPEISGPGVSVLSAVSSFTDQDYSMEREIEFNGKTYPFARFSGTSMSGPAVAGVAALVIEANPDLTAEQVYSILMNTARQDNRTGLLPENGDNTWGHGKVNALAAVKMAMETTGDWYVASDYLLFPNPVSDYLHYKGSRPEVSYDCKLITLEGKIWMQGKIGFTSPLLVSDIPNGLYILQIHDGEKPRFYKVIIHR